VEDLGSTLGAEGNIHGRWRYRICQLNTSRGFAVALLYMVKFTTMSQMPYAESSLVNMGQDL